MNKVVPRDAKGTLVKGSSMNVDVAKPTIDAERQTGRLGALFFVVPVDTRSNNTRILVNRAEARRDRQGDRSRPDR